MLWQEKCADGIRTFFFALLHAKRGVFVHALRVRVWGGVPTPRILSCFFKSREKPRSVLPRQGHAFRETESSRKGTDLFFSLVRKEPKVHQRSADLWTPGTVQIAGRYGIVDRMTGFYQVTGFAEVAFSHSIDGNDLNRCKLQA